uniref:DUF7940 domain-containing protein n=1 Tax=Erwinia citreus TaxID=558 RepID=UPI00289CDED5
MKFILFILLILLVTLVVWWIIKQGNIELVSHARLLFRAWSVWLASAGSVMGAWVQSFPDSASSAWNGLPADVKTVIPQQFLGFLASFMVAMAVLAQFIRQKKLAAAREMLMTTGSSGLATAGMFPGAVVAMCSTGPTGPSAYSGNTPAGSSAGTGPVTAVPASPAPETDPAAAPASPA